MPIRVARFFFGQIYQMAAKTIPNVHKIYQTAVKCSNGPYVNYAYQFSIPGTSKKYSNCEFWYGNIPSGNP
jgi:hypothetical protein